MAESGAKQNKGNSSRSSRGRLLASALVVALVISASLAAIAVLRQPDKQPVVTFVGDSYTAGSVEDSGYAHRYPALVAQSLDVRPEVVAEPGAGYVHQGVVGVPFADEVSAIPADSDVVLVYGSRNDPFDGSIAASIGDAAEALFSAIKTKAPDAVVVVIGPSYVETPIPVGGIANADAIREAARVEDVRYVDALSWLQDPQLGVIGADAVHPTDAGHDLLAQRITPIIEQALHSRE